MLSEMLTGTCSPEVSHATAQIVIQYSQLGNAAFVRWLLSFVVVLFSAGCATRPAFLGGEKVFSNVLFASPQGQQLRMDLYVPRTEKPAPVVIWIFGGSWKFGSKSFHVNVRDLTRHGIAVASIEYRLSGKAKHPAQLDDCRSALHWLRENGGRFGIDPHRIGVSGESAGGHLAALLGNLEGAPRIRAVFAMYPPTDLVILGRKYANPYGPTNIDLLLGGPLEEKLAMAAKASPVNQVRRSSPPFLLIHGARDELVPIEQSEMLKRKLENAGVPVRLIVVPNKEHWFFLNKEQVSEVAEFFLAHFNDAR
jgi:acetyl esterase/lipase